MQTRTITTIDELLKLRVAWEELHRASNGTLFQHPEWLSTWWELFGPTRRLEVRTYWNDGLLVGILPMFTETRKLAVLKFRRMSLLGDAMVHGEYFPLVESSSTDEVARDAGDFFVGELRKRTIEVLDFRSFPPDSSFMNTFLSGLSEGATLRCEPKDYPHIVAEGPRSGKEYLGILPKGRRHDLQRSQRRLADAGAEFRVLAEWDGGKSFEDLVRLHTARWNYAGEPGRLSRYWFCEFLRRMTERLMQTGNARIYSIWFNGEPLVSTLVFKMYRRHYGYVTGRHPTHELMRHGVGNVNVLRMMVDAFEEGCDCFDLMGGDYSYKNFFGPTKKWYARATAIAAGLKGVKGWVFLAALPVHHMLEQRKKARPIKKPAGQAPS